MDWFTDGEDRALALVIAENEEHLDLAGHDQQERGLVNWDVICSKFYARIGSTRRSRRQIQERFRALKRTETGQKKLRAAREDFELEQAAKTLVELAARSRVQ